jgi:hypothetical protein
VSIAPQKITLLSISTGKNAHPGIDEKPFVSPGIRLSAAKFDSTCASLASSKATRVLAPTAAQ